MESDTESLSEPTMLDPTKIQQRLECLRHELSIGSAARRFKEADSLVAAFIDSVGYPEVAIQFLLTREWQTLPDEREFARRRIAETRTQYKEIPCGPPS